MVIKREVNGQTMEFKLNYEELMEASNEFDWEHAINSIMDRYDCSEAEAKLAASRLMDVLRKKDSYGELYFACLDLVCQAFDMKAYDDSNDDNDNDEKPWDYSQHFD